MNIARTALLLVFSSVSLFTSASFAGVTPPADGQIDIWSRITFIPGADLGKLVDGTNKTRAEFIASMTSQAQTLMNSNMRGFEALNALIAFNSMYDQIRNDAINNNPNIPVTLEANLKAFLDQYYQDLRPSVKRIHFVDNSILTSTRSQADIKKLFGKLDYVGYGVFTFVPGGNLQVSLELIGRTGRSISFVETGYPSTVMSQIASRVFEAFQRTQFPSKIKIGDHTLTILRGQNGNIGQARLDFAARTCQNMGARLPDAFELETINSYGDWSGGVSLGHDVWAIAGGKVYAPDLSSSPVRDPSQVNGYTFKYICVK